jgi:hypothetical protein
VQCTLVATSCRIGPAAFICLGIGDLSAQVPHAAEAAPLAQATDSSMRAWELQRMAEVAAAAGLAPLASTTLGSGDREARLRASFALGAPNEFLHLRVRGQRIDGELYLYWDTPADSFVRAFLKEKYGDRCSPIHETARVNACELRFAKPPNWRTILSRLDSLGFDRLRGSTKFGLDGYGLTVEYKAGNDHRLVSYWSPREGSDCDETRAATIYDLILHTAAQP